MNSLSELNAVSAQQVEYVDQRIPRIIFDRLTPTNQNISVTEGSTHTVPVGIEIQEIINSDANATTYTINVGNAVGTTVVWSIIPSGCVVTNPSPGIYVISGINSVEIWNQIKSPTIVLPNNYFGEFTYTATITYKAGTETKFWIVGVAVTEVEALTNTLSFNFNPTTTYTNLAGTPRVVDEGPQTPTWTVTLTPSVPSAVTSLSSSGSGGSSSFNGSTKVLTITGTKTQVNTHLDSITFVSSSVETDFFITYYASNNLNAETATKTQNFLSAAIIFLGGVRDVVYYNEDTVTAVDGGPLVTDIDYDGSGTYTMTITPNPTSAVLTMSATGTGGSAVWNPTSKALTITGNRTQVNTYIDNISLTPAGDYNVNFSLSYNLVTPRSTSVTKIQLILIGSLNNEVENMNVSRSYVANNENILFPNNIPYISDIDPAPNLIYTIYLNCSFGEFATTDPITNPSSNWSYSGTKEQVNAIFSQIKFYPTLNVSSSGLFTYSQYKNSVLQVSQDVAITGSTGTLPSATTTFTSSQTWTPPYPYLKYGTVSVLLVGGGGGGAVGGGGGGQVIQSLNTELSLETYNIVIGQGGYGGISDIYTNTTETPAGPGGNTTAFGLTALGGGGASSALGGNSGSNKLGGSGNGSDSSGYCGGGGAGSFTDGQSSQLIILGNQWTRNSNTSFTVTYSPFSTVTCSQTSTIENELFLSSTTGLIPGMVLGEKSPDGNYPSSIIEIIHVKPNSVIIDSTSAQNILSGTTIYTYKFFDPKSYKFSVNDIKDNVNSFNITTYPGNGQFTYLYSINSGTLPAAGTTLILTKQIEGSRGGSGTYSSITGNFYGGGGSGATMVPPTPAPSGKIGGLGGGGQGYGYAKSAIDGEPNTGGGGGGDNVGGISSPRTGKIGGSGVVVVKINQK